MNITQYWWAVRILRQAYQSKQITGLPATAVAAQAILETGYGKHIPIDIKTGKFSYNLFGIKCLVKDGEIISAGNNGCVQCYTHEEIKGYKKLKLLYFRAYKTYKDSFNDHAKVLAISRDNQGGQRYREAFNYLEDPEQFITELWKAGYATDSGYINNILPIIQSLKKIPVWILKL